MIFVDVFTIVLPFLAGDVGGVVHSDFPVHRAVHPPDTRGHSARGGEGHRVLSYPRLE